jgi:hypothetical protein
MNAITEQKQTTGMRPCRLAKNVLRLSDRRNGDILTQTGLYVYFNELQVLNGKYILNFSSQTLLRCCVMWSHRNFPTFQRYLAKAVIFKTLDLLL